jgi:hypothetical protein
MEPLGDEAHLFVAVNRAGGWHPPSTPSGGGRAFPIDPDLQEQDTRPQVIADHGASA